MQNSKIRNVFQSSVAFQESKYCLCSETMLFMRKKSAGVRINCFDFSFSWCKIESEIEYEKTFPGLGEKKMTEQNAKIGLRIRRLRKARGMTLLEMSEKTELSTGFLSKLENDQTSPTLVNLHKLCEALNITINDLLTGQNSQENLQIVRAEERSEIFSDNGNVRYEAVTEGDTAVKVSAMHLLSDEECESYPHSHDELGIIVSGKVRITVDGKSDLLSAGDSIYIRAGSSHSLQKIGDEECVSYWIKTSGSAEQFACHTGRTKK